MPVAAESALTRALLVMADEHQTRIAERQTCDQESEGLRQRVAIAAGRSDPRIDCADRVLHREGKLRLAVTLGAFGRILMCLRRSCLVAVQRGVDQ